MADGVNESASRSVQAASGQPPQWTVVASDGPLMLAQSGQEYAVYDQQNSYGRWPLTEEGHRYAIQTYEAHRQSLVHGIAYTATGYQDPTRLGLPTEPIIKSKTYASPMSFVGSTRRIIAWAGKMAKRSPALAAVGWTLGILFMLFMWCFLVFWYFIIFGLFGIFVLPFRAMRRGQRKNLHTQQTALATQQAMLQQMAMQQQAIAQQQRGYVPPAQPLPPPSVIPPPSH